MTADLDPAALLDGLAARHGVPGAQLALHRDGRTRCAVTGHRVAGLPEPIDEDTAFPLGSLTKPVTAAVAVELVADGELDLDEPLAGHLPAFGAGEVVTLRSLLTHTSGLAASVAQDTLLRSAPRWLQANAGRADLTHRPGAVFSYSNVGYLVVGALVTALTGLSWADAAGSIVLEPLGVTPAFVLAPSSRPVATGHVVGAGRTTPVTHPELPAIEEPAGGLALSALDLVAVARRFVGPPDPSDPLAAMPTDQLSDVPVGPFGMADGWGLGWARYAGTDAVVAGHDGTGDGTSCHLRFDPDGDLVVALTTNATSGRAMWTELLERLRAAGVDVPDHPVDGLDDSDPPVPPPTGCHGVYVDGASTFTVRPGEHDALRLDVDGRAHGELRCRSDLAFTMCEYAGDARYTGRFVAERADGPVSLLQVSGRTARRR